jgi:hypothetical protein
MRRTLLFTCLAFLFVTAYAQENSYIIKTHGAKHKSDLQLVDHEGEDETAIDFISQNFKYQSLCEWKEGMKFMVIPDEYDLVVKTFTDAATDKDVSNVKLRHKIMIYQGHKEEDDGHEFIYFLCQDDNRKYYYDISGSFDDYCYEKKGIPTLAYLGDVDIAREKLVGKEVYTKTDVYRIDTEVDGDGYKEVIVDKDMQVEVSAVGVGTRDFPVKIIVKDKEGNEFYQNVAISKTNSGMRDDEFIMDNTKFLFAGSFELQDALMEVSKNLAEYIGKDVHTKYSTNMITQGDGKERTLKVPRMTSFTIENILPKRNSQYVTLTLKEFESRRIYFKDVTFTNVDNVTGDIDGRREDFFGYLFAMGAGKARNTTQAARAAIREGRVILRMTEDEVTLAMGEPARTVEGNNGRHDWIYNRSNGKLLVVQFDASGTVIGTKVDRTGSKAPVRRRTTAAKRKK